MNSSHWAGACGLVGRSDGRGRCPSARLPSMGAGCQRGDAGMRLNVEAMSSYVDHTRSRLVLIIYNEMGKH